MIFEQGIEGDAEKPEDWEHEEERADDDVDMGDQEGSEHDASPVKRCAFSAASLSLYLRMLNR